MVRLSELDVNAGPPLWLHLSHFFVGFVFLLAAGVVWLLGEAYYITRLHLLLAGWVGVTILGAMNQFVPVWSNVELHSERIAVAQLPLVSVGVAGVAFGFVSPLPLTVFGGLAVAGFWIFVYNHLRTLLSVSEVDVTGRHFGYGLFFFFVSTSLGFVLLLDIYTGYVSLSLGRGGVVAHATLAVFGGVISTIIGAMYQLLGMFTQTERGKTAAVLLKTEEATYPAGVALSATGYLVSPRLVSVGVLLTTAGLAAFSVFVLFTLRNSTVEVRGNAVLSRYAVVSLACVSWSVAASTAVLTGSFVAPFSGDTGLVLVLAAVSLTVIGSLYHIVPFLVWLEVYSDRVGLEKVPMPDDLYDRRAERVELAVTVTGFVGLTVGSVLGLESPLPRIALVAGFFVFVGNLSGAVFCHRLR